MSERRCKWCRQPSELLDFDRRRVYCCGLCFELARKAYLKRLDAKPERQAMHRRTALAYRQRCRDGHEPAPREDRRVSRQQALQRDKLIRHAWAEARARGIGVRDVLTEWKAPLGHAGKQENARRAER